MWNNTAFYEGHAEDLNGATGQPKIELSGVDGSSNKMRTYPRHTFDDTDLHTHAALAQFLPHGAFRRKKRVVLPH
jgi:hypothetical protein